MNPFPDQTLFKKPDPMLCLQGSATQLLTAGNRVRVINLIKYRFGNDLNRLECRPVAVSPDSISKFSEYMDLT